MKILGSPKNKVIAASLLMLPLAVAAQANGLPAVGIARALVGAGAVAGLIWWMRRARRTEVAAAPPRLEVVARTGLSARSGLALVRADGRTYLVAHGDGFAEIREAVGTAPAQARRPRSIGGRRSLTRTPRRGGSR